MFNTRSKHLLILLSLLLIPLFFFSIENSSGNPYRYWYEVESPVKTIVQFTGPTENDTLLNSDKISVTFDAKIITAGYDTCITQITYSTSGGNGKMVLYQRSSDSEPHLSQYQYNLTLTRIPQGNQSISIYLFGSGWYSGGLDRYTFTPRGSATLTFTVDTEAPIINLQQLNETYVNSTVPLTFTANEPFSKAAYSIDAGTNVTTTSNLTLSGLEVGPYNITIYVWDEAGNVGKSETAYFNVTEPVKQAKVSIEPIIAVIVLSTAVIVCSCVFLLIWKHRYMLRQKGK